MTQIKLMIDHNYWGITQRLNAIGGKVQAFRTADYGFRGEAKDPDLVKATSKNNCVLFTRNKNTITPRKFKPCEHGGIIVFKPRLLSHDDVFEIVKVFCHSGERRTAVGHFTYLHKDHAVIHTHKETVKVEWRKLRGRWRYSRTVHEPQY